ncbi:hypothetical protein [Streptomyces halstedii]|uniref:hypothetical protein n=1 Tax=Streptomyces halstedii TaxID=1944 RepID=UPI0036D03354
MPFEDSQGGVLVQQEVEILVVLRSMARAAGLVGELADKADKADKRSGPGGRVIHVDDRQVDRFHRHACQFEAAQSAAS